jgi:cystathionine beta-lyase/cystathionine gamma-synthase
LQLLIAQPIKWEHLVVHSATKLMDGQGVLGGVTVGDQLIHKTLFHAWDLLYLFNAGFYQKFRDISNSFR